MGQFGVQAEPEQPLDDLFTFQASHAGTGGLIAATPWPLRSIRAEAPLNRLGPSPVPAATAAGAVTAALVVAGLLELARVIPWWIFALVIALGVVITS